MSNISDKLMRRSGSGFFPIIGSSLFEHFFDDLGSFEDNIDRFFGNDQVVPYDVIQIKDDKGNVTAHEINYALAGYDKDNITIDVDGDWMTIVVDKKEDQEDKEAQNFIYRISCFVN